MINDDAIINAMSSQNDHVISMINRAEDGAELERARDTLELLRPMWEACGYEYKVLEVRRRIAKRASVLADGERNYIAGCRKNDRTLNSSRANLAKLEALSM